MSRIAVVSAKGGVGKTTVSLNLALAYAESGHPTLLVDLDPQGAIGHSLLKSDAEWPGLVDVLAGRARIEDVAVRTHERNLTIVPRGRLDAADAVLFEDLLRPPGTLAKLLTPFARSHVRTILDTPAGVGTLGRVALASADYALVIVKAEPLALRTTHQMLRVVEQIRETQQPSLALLGILPTMVELGREYSHAPLFDLWSSLHAVLETTIPRSHAIAQASLKGVPVSYLSDPPPAETHRFAQLATELEQRMLSRFADRKTEHDHSSPARSLV